MSYRNQLQRVKQQKRLNDNFNNRFQDKHYSPYTAREQAHRQIMSNYFDREIERLTDLATHEMVIEKLKSIDYNVTLNGEKITDAVIEQFSRGFRK